MAIAVECESCGAKFKVADTFAGKRGKCPECSAIFTARAASSTTPALAAAKRPGTSGSSVAKSLSPQKPAQSQPGTAKVSPASVKPAQGRPVASHVTPVASSIKPVPSNVKPAAAAKQGKQSPPPVKVVPVGSLPDDIPVGGIPGGSSVSKAVVRPALGSIPTGKPSTTHGKKHKRKKGTPIIIWVIIVLGGLSSAGGWIYVATREPAKPLVASATKTNSPADKEAAEKKFKDSSKTEGDATEDEPATDDAESGKNGAQRKLSVVPEATDEKQGEALGEALGSDADLVGGNKTSKSGTSPVATAATPVATPKEVETEREATAAAAPAADAVSAEQLTELAAACQKNAWKADSKEQYAALLAVAGGMMNTADDAAYETARKLLEGPIRDIVWTTEGVRRINRYAAKDLDKIGQSCFTVAEVVEQIDGGALLKLVTTESLIKLEMSGSQLALARPGKNFLLIGTITPESHDLPPAEGGEAKRARVIDAMYRMGITEIYDREASTIGPAGGGE